MNRSIATFVLLMTFIATSAFAEPQTPVRNVIVIGVDDLRANLGAYGADWTQTPNLDRLASMGVQFNRAYTNVTICNPSRASFLSGLYPETTGVLTNRMPPRENPMLADAKFFPEAFEQAGYFTANIGKVEHKQYQDTMDVDEFSNPQDNFDESSVVHAGEIGKRFRWKAVDAPDDRFGDGMIADRIVELIKEKAGGDEPFFLQAGFHKPHADWIAPKRFFDAHPPDDMPLMPHGILSPPNTRGPLEGQRQIPILDDDEERMVISMYAAGTSFMDEQVGKIMRAMDEEGLWGNTAVIFFSDHGFSLGEHDQWSKFNQWESTARIPFIIVAPGVKPAQSDTPVELVDMYPTMMELAGLEPPHELEGDSLVPVLENPDALTDGIAYTVFGHTEGESRARVRSIRTPDYAYIQYYEGHDVLFSADDPDETVDLSQDPSYAEVLEQMRYLLENARTADYMDTPATQTP
ncbi:MAG: sulfatase [Planctomycetota bacterium]